MAVLECKMCGGKLVLQEGSQIAECENCGREQTVPSADDEKKLALFARANRLLFNCEFDKAAGIYESIIADFPTEGEAYWDLVLCKYGVEYVDDTATGEKIPTCHRSSFESVMDDPNLEQALDFSDSWARRLRREEAKRIEQVRKGIIEVSAKEEPYDIFICYKETDVHGNRTLDSVLAQDTYDALTERGYRVFFSRITLEDKLGVEYEPYIFAALNSAKLMLVFGTCEEHFNAVWVKNEWSRYLQLMAKDKTKHLIPCYKGVDAYDMPKVFARLQALDLGKMGADQDLLRGVEKLLPRQKAVEKVVQVQQVVQPPAAANPNAAALLKRGHMALEDGDWKKAEGFFEQVLNYDAESAEAYLGKYLLNNQAASLEKLQNRFSASRQPLKRENQTINNDRTREEELISRYAVPGYLTRSQIKSQLAYSNSYSTAVAGAKLLLRTQEEKLRDNKDLTRARNYAQGELKEQLESFVSAVVEPLRKQVEQEQVHEQSSIEQAKKRYQAFLRSAEEKLQSMHQSAEQQREGEYTALCNQMDEDLAAKPLKTERLKYLIDGFRKVGEYKEAPQKLKQVAAVLSAEEDRLLKDAELKRRKEEKDAELKRKKEEKEKATIGLIVIAVIVLVVIGLIVFVISLFTTIIPGSKYSKAEELFEAGDYTGAFEVFHEVGTYKDSQERAYECAEMMAENGKTSYAAISFGKLSGYKDARGRSVELWSAAIRPNTICYHSGSSFAVGTDGKIKAAFGSYLGLVEDWKSWTNVTSICIEGDHLVAVLSDGTVEICCGSTIKCSTCDKVRAWTDIVQVACNKSMVLGLKLDGTVVGANIYGNGIEATGWTDIVYLAAGGDDVCAGVKADGSVVGSNLNESLDAAEFSDIVAVDVSYYHTVGVRSDGTVAVSGNNTWNQHDAEAWTDVVDVACSLTQVFCLTGDGRVLAAGEYYSGGTELVSGGAADVSADYDLKGCIVLYADGTMSGRAGYDDYSWSGIMLP